MKCVIFSRDGSDGVTPVNFQDAALKKLILAMAGSVAVALTSEKPGSVASFKVCAVDNVDGLILEKRRLP